MIFTIGHSTLEFSDFIVLLRSNEVSLIVDIRRYPMSRRNPAFTREKLATTIPQNGMEYLHIESLGGWRGISKKTSRDSGWRNSSFRAYSEYMQSPDFLKGLKQLMNVEAKARMAGGKVAIMCAEAIPWKCHRMLVSDALTANGFRIEHIIAREELLRHKMTPSARLNEPTSGIISVSYPHLDTAI